MKRSLHYKLFLGAILLALSSNIFGQIVTQTVNLRAFCCNDGDSIDIGNDGQHDIKILGDQGFDSRAYFIQSLQNNIEVASAFDSGSVFSPYRANYTTINSTSLGCWWSNLWLPGSGIKYAGFRRINAPNDTTYGWIKLDFLGTQGTCEDTMVSNEIAYNTTPNSPITAGQRMAVTNVPSSFADEYFSVYPNPFSNHLSIEVSPEAPATITVYNIFSQAVLVQTFSKSLVINTEDLPNGMYLYTLKNSAGAVKQGKVFCSGK